MIPTPALVACLAAAVPAAGPIADLDAALARLEAREPLRARFTFRIETANGAGADQVRTKGEVTGELASGEAGLSITWPRTALAQAREEERRRTADPEAAAPVHDAMAAANALDLAHDADAAAALRQALDGATLVKDEATTLDGAPARLLVLDVKPGLSARERRYVKEVTASLRLWLGEDGLPRAAEVESRGSGRFLLVVSFTAEQREALRFERVGDRLVAVRHEITRRSEGAGDRGERRTTAELTVVRGPTHPPEK